MWTKATRRSKASLWCGPKYSRGKNWDNAWFAVKHRMVFPRINQSWQRFFTCPGRQMSTQAFASSQSQDCRVTSPARIGSVWLSKFSTIQAWRRSELQRSEIRAQPFLAQFCQFPAVRIRPTPYSKRLSHIFTFFLTYLLTFFLTYFLTFFLTYLLTWSWLRSGAEYWNTELTGSRLRSGAEHWTHRIVVEVRRGTLASQDRGWGPARNTEHTHGTPNSHDRGWDPTQKTDEEEEEEEEDRAHMKSNNPHLTGGEPMMETKTLQKVNWNHQRIRSWFKSFQGGPKMKCNSRKEQE